MTGRVHLARETQPPRRSSGWNTIEGFALPDEPWNVDGVWCVGVIDDPESYADALIAAMRGVDVAVDVAEPYLDALLEDAHRAGIAVAVGPLDVERPEWEPLLDLLAEGATVAEAASACHMSMRSAYRRLADARRALAVSTTTSAVTTWVRSKQPR